MKPKRDKIVGVRLSQKEFRAIRTQAAPLGMTVPAYLRMLALKQSAG